jgi:hypothetical protein
MENSSETAHAHYENLSEIKPEILILVPSFFFFLFFSLPFPDHGPRINSDTAQHESQTEHPCPSP